MQEAVLQRNSLTTASGGKVNSCSKWRFASYPDNLRFAYCCQDEKRMSQCACQLMVSFVRSSVIGENRNVLDQSETLPRMSDIIMQRHKYFIKIISDWMLFRLQLLKRNGVNYFRATKIIHCWSRVVLCHKNLWLHLEWGRVWILETLVMIVAADLEIFVGSVEVCTGCFRLHTFWTLLLEWPWCLATVKRKPKATGLTNSIF